MAAFPFEARMNDLNPNYHSAGDTYANMNNDASHSAKFTKLALEFVIEVAKNDQMSTIDQTFQNNLNIVVNDKQLIYEIPNFNGKVENLVIYDASARKVITQSNLNSKGKISLNQLNTGFYIAVLKDQNGKTFSKKFLIK